MVTDVLATYEEYEYYKARGESPPVKESDYSEAELTTMMESIKK